MLERYDGESARAHAARHIYATTGVGRSLDAVAQKLGKSKALLERWSKRWDWVACAAEWDAAQLEEAARRAGEAYQAEVAALRSRITTDCARLRALHNGAVANIAGRLQALTADDIPATAIPAWLRALTAMAQTIADMEAMALGIEVKVGEAQK